MSNLLWRKFNLCFSNIKCLSAPPPPLPESPPYENPNRSPPTKNTTMMKNFNSIYTHTSTSTSKSLYDSSDDFFLSSDEFSDDSHTTKFTRPDFATLFASQRFFFTSPGFSNSIVDSSPEIDTCIENGVAFTKISPDPYVDFRKSMQEMLEAKDHDRLLNVKDKLDYLHELLLHYLTLNPKPNHKYIISAFSDLVVCLMSKNFDDRRGHHVTQRVFLNEDQVVSTFCGQY